jgi:hypothetical protein
MYLFIDVLEIQSIYYIPELPKLQTTPSISETTSNSVKVGFQTWQPSMGGSGPVVSYMVQYRQDISGSVQWKDGVFIAHTGATNLEVVQTGLSYNTSYRFRVVPVYSDGSITINGIASSESILITTTGITLKYYTRMFFLCMCSLIQFVTHYLNHNME